MVTFYFLLFSERNYFKAHKLFWLKLRSLVPAGGHILSLSLIHLGHLYGMSPKSYPSIILSLLNKKKNLIQIIMCIPTIQQVFWIGSMAHSLFLDILPNRQGQNFNPPKLVSSCIGKVIICLSSFDYLMISRHLF